MRPPLPIGVTKNYAIQQLSHKTYMYHLMISTSAPVTGQFQLLWVVLLSNFNHVTSHINTIPKPTGVSNIRNGKTIVAN